MSQILIRSLRRKIVLSIVLFLLLSCPCFRMIRSIIADKVRSGLENLVRKQD